jgi:hypothetical protein
MIEFLFLLAVLSFIAVLFYRDSKTSFELLQLEAERIDELPELYSEKHPIVLRGLSFPSLGTYAEMKNRPHILQLGVTPNLSLDALLHSPQLSSFRFTEETTSFLAKESGLPIWCANMLYPKILPSFARPIYSTKESLWPVFVTYCSCGDSLNPGKISGPNLFTLLSKLNILSDRIALSDVGILLDTIEILSSKHELHVSRASSVEQKGC